MKTVSKKIRTVSSVLARKALTAAKIDRLASRLAYLDGVRKRLGPHATFKAGPKIRGQGGW